MSTSQCFLHPFIAAMSRQRVSPEQEPRLPPEAASRFTSAQPSIEPSINHLPYSAPFPPFPKTSPRQTAHASGRLLEPPTTPFPFDNSQCETRRVSGRLPETPSAPCSVDKSSNPKRHTSVPTKRQQKRKTKHAPDMEPQAPFHAPSLPSPPPASSSKRKLDALDGWPSLEDAAEFKQQYNNKHHPKSQETALRSEELPFASGGYLAIDNAFHGAQVRCDLKRMKAEGFRLVTSEDRMSVPLTDRENHIMACVLYGSSSKSYRDSVQTMADAILDMGKQTKWKRAEKKHKHGHFPALARGISFGKGQPEPMRLSDEHQPLMEELLQMPCFRQVAGHQSAALATWSLKSYLEHQCINRELKEKLPHLQRNFDNNSMNDVRIPCAITSGGKYNYKLGGHLILWDLKVVIEFPPGATILLSLALLRHSNQPVAPGETPAQDPEGFSIAWAKRREGWKESLQFFGTLEELKLNAL
ncbi:hypothetical protein F5051DRAFT_446413 [Lentinula edodes]|nr:hypothetical protein F5051DRAFT_446413 [Lentinula edodes]